VGFFHHLRANKWLIGRRAATGIVYNDNCAILGLRPATVAVVPDVETAAVYFDQPITTELVGVAVAGMPFPVYRMVLLVVNLDCH